MRKAGLLALLLILGPALCSQVLSQTDEEILQQADRARFLEADSYGLTVRVTVERPGEEPGQALLRTLFKRFAEGYRVRIEFLEPEAMRGMIYLVVGEEIYFWKPELVQPLRVSGQQKLFGDASIIETARFSLADYKIESREQTQLDGQEAIKLELQAEGRAAYQWVTLWVDLEFKPLQALLRSLGGEPLKRVLYRRYAEHEGDELVVEFTIENLLFQEYRTLISIEEISLEDLPDHLFDPGALGTEEGG
jgi:outer membrane lipoprotein-sorting protein